MDEADPVAATDHALYGISVAAELSGATPQTLRVYESRGLLEPQRTAGGTRRYSGNDVLRVREIVVLLEAGLNLAGIAEVLVLRAEADRLRAEVKSLRNSRGLPRKSR